MFFSFAEKENLVLKWATKINDMQIYELSNSYPPTLNKIQFLICKLNKAFSILLSVFEWYLNRWINWEEIMVLPFVFEWFAVQTITIKKNLV